MQSLSNVNKKTHFFPPVIPVTENFSINNTKQMVPDKTQKGGFLL